MKAEFEGHWGFERLGGLQVLTRPRVSCRSEDYWGSGSCTLDSWSVEDQRVSCTYEGKALAEG